MRQGSLPRGVGAPPTLVDRVCAPGVDSFASIFIYSKNILRESKYIKLELRSLDVQGAHEAAGRAPTLMDRVWAP